MKPLRKISAPCMGHRIGTCRAELTTLCCLLGDPSHDWRGTQDRIPLATGGYFIDTPKVTLTWIFQTPRGPAEIRDYWWNAATEWTIAAQNHKAALWLAKYLRSLGLRASTRYHDLSKVPQ